MNNLFLYIISSSKRRPLLKIGRSNNPVRRLRAMQGQCTTKLSLVACFEVSSCKAETDSHKALEKYRKHGEWFTAPIELALSVVREIAEKYPVTEQHRKEKTARKERIGKSLAATVEMSHKQRIYEQLAHSMQSLYPQETLSDGLRNMADEIANGTLAGKAFNSLVSANQVLMAASFVDTEIRRLKALMDSQVMPSKALTTVGGAS